jgi:predicted RNA-binding Zn-ribbon protein involved in translation (DUF1610 family)
MGKSVRWKCIVCGGDIVEEIVSKFNPIHGPMIIGPGSRQQFHDVSEGYHCSSCGLKYEFPPKTEKKDQ